jgi:hypothetical protein
MGSKQSVDTECTGATLISQFTNMPNHLRPSNPNMKIGSPQTWGVASGQGNSPRRMDFGRISL